MFSGQVGEILAALAKLTPPQLEDLRAMMDMMNGEGIRNPSIRTGQPLADRYYGGTRVGNSDFLGQRQRMFYRDSDKSLNAIGTDSFQCDLSETTYVLPAANMETCGGVSALNARDSVHKHLDANAATVAMHEVLTGDDAHSGRGHLFVAAHGASMMPEETRLTQRQRSVLVLMQEGLLNKDIAQRMGLTEHTVKEHVSAILKRLGVRTRFQAVSRMKRLNEHDQSFEPAQSTPITPEELGLTQRQGAVLVQLLEGLPNKLIARNLGLSLNTVKEHVSAILQRLDLRTRSQVISRMKHFRVRAAVDR
ncbi:LuxR C-terminal-related transcriptional regulator [Cupriavidus basilensis]|uniref:LuxR C-terminal-related transcriptional regulator n=1 Tax=Cupriavidus basilensis TaxID=68895 RepID=UPI0020C74081|nr:LuxR C-terminal-related transcriptional regulator [Cupriavidus basilensis]